MWSKGGILITNVQIDERISKYYPNITRISDYINSKTAIEFACSLCGRIYRKKPKELNKIKCSCKERETLYKELIKDKDISLLENYKNSREKILHCCNICNLEFISSPKSQLNSKVGCPSCSGKLFSKDKYKSLLPNNIKLISDEYCGSNYKHLHLCIDCKTEFYTKPNYILHLGTNCPICCKSKGERIIMNFLDSISIKYDKEHRNNIGNKMLRFDFYIPSINTFIEYDGIQHFKPVEIFGGEKYFKELKVNDKLKENWCKEMGYKLIRISYDLDIKEIHKLLNDNI